MSRGGDTEIISPEALLAIARLAHKYEADELLLQAIKCLQTYYSAKFGVWSQHSPNSHFMACVPPHHAIGVINLARLIGTPLCFQWHFTSAVPFKARSCTDGSGRTA
ncbi:hypothetical protein BC628DRAFT_1396652 [Trametes gibbosa]|nr:hypothetical protein BC628DRAFT_1396652 [Trametes gibbosa]